MVVSFLWVVVAPVARLFQWYQVRHMPAPTTRALVDLHWHALFALEPVALSRGFVVRVSDLVAAVALARAEAHPSQPS